jgi:hypothetical protein
MEKPFSSCIKQGKRKLLSIGEYGREQAGKLSLAEARKKYIEYENILNAGRVCACIPALFCNAEYLAFTLSKN